MGELLEQWPSAALTLFARYGVGSREKLGFRPEQTLREVLTRHLIFEPQPVLARLEEAEREQRGFRVGPGEFAARMSSGRVVDCRSREEFACLRLPGATYLDGELARVVRAEPSVPLWLYDHQGPMAGAAAVHFAGMGVRQVHVLAGGIHAWALQVDAGMPLYGAPAGSHPERPRLLADRRQARFPCAATSVALEGDASRVPFGCERVWRSGRYVAVLRASSQDWLPVARAVAAWVGSEEFEEHPWREQARAAGVRERVERILREEVQPTLKSHKGEVELVSWEDGVAGVALSGGCQGCSSAAITVSEEIAAILFGHVPELEGVVDASWHEDPAATPHH
jgi:Fe-S cluster biogenesis protein NfuA/rhodanese-related sulfurtransferase